MPRSERGLTLLEVLGAVALLGILYTVLAGSAIEGLRSEGASRRRLEASLLADERLAELELSLDAGTPPPDGPSEEEVDEFTVVTEVLPFEPPPAAEDAAERAADPSSLAARRAAAAAAAKDAPSLFAPPKTPTSPSPLRSIEIIVRWSDGIDEQEVRRTTYAVDTAAVEELFASLAEFQSKRPPQAKGAEDPGGAASSKKKKEQATAPLPPFELPPPGETETEP